MNVLIIDDEPDTVTFLGAWLEDEGHRACSAANGNEGMQVILSECPDLVLLDIKMPGQTGIQLYRDMRQHAALRCLPVIFITGMAEFHVFDDQCGPLPEPLACVQKPIDLAALRAAIRLVKQ